MDKGGFLQPGEDAVEPMGLLLIWIPINICYTFGWAIELAGFLISPGRAWRGPMLMRIGLVVSLLALLIPVFAVGISILFHQRR